MQALNGRNYVEKLRSYVMVLSRRVKRIIVTAGDVQCVYIYRSGASVSPMPVMLDQVDLGPTRCVIITGTRRLLWYNF